MRSKLLIATALLSVLSLIRYPASSRGAPFEIQVVDANGNGMPNMRVIADHRIVCYTDQHGRVRWSEQELMEKTVGFRVETWAGHSNTEFWLRVKRGGHARLIAQ
jgi:hypothetical protein